MATLLLIVKDYNLFNQYSNNEPRMLREQVIITLKNYAFSKKKVIKK